MSDDLTHGADDAGWVLMMLAAFGTIGHFFWHVAPRIICSRCAVFVIVRLRLGRIFCALNLRGRVAGGVDFWRGNVFAGGVCKQGLSGVGVEQRGGADSGGVGEAAALCSLAVGLARHPEGGGALRGAVVDGGKGGKDGGHCVPRVNRARRLVVAAPGWERYALPTCSRQRIVDALGLLPAQINHAKKV